MAVDIYRGTTNVVLPEAVSNEIWGNVVEESAFMQLARKINIPGTGVKVQTITGEPEADWVGETELKPVGRHTFGKKDVIPYKLAVIEPFSNEFRRDKAALYAECVNRAPKALGRKFDETIQGTNAPGAGFDVLGGATTISIATDTYAQFLAADGAISAAGGVMDGIALSPAGKSIVLGAVDGQQRPLFTTGVESGTVGNILGAKVMVNKGIGATGTPNIVGIAGDFENAVWGSVEGIQVAISDQATLTDGEETINLWQQNMFAVRFEIEVAFAVQDVNQFVLLTD